jgi:hypothetical protein
MLSAGKVKVAVHQREDNVVVFLRLHKNKVMCTICGS